MCGCQRSEFVTDIVYMITIYDKDSIAGLSEIEHNLFFAIAFLSTFIGLNTSLSVVIKMLSENKYFGNELQKENWSQFLLWLPFRIVMLSPAGFIVLVLQ